MNKKLIYILTIFILSSCSLDTKSGFWSKSEIIKKGDKSAPKEIFKKSKIYKKELNSNIKIKLKAQYSRNSFINNLTNNNGHINFDGQIEKISKYKFSKIDHFQFTQPELVFTDDKSLIFFDNKGTILKFDKNSKLLWNSNIYKKREKKLNPLLFFSLDKNTLLVADNLANYYSLNIATGNINWKKNNTAPFNSQIKIYKDKFFIVDFDNILRCFSLKDGSEIWNFKTEKSFIISQQKLSLVIKDNTIVFINTIGDVSSINIDNGNLLWQTPTQSNVIYENAFSLQNSDLVLKDNSIYFSNNKNELFSLDFKSGVLKWKQKVNSNIRPTVVENLLFTVSIEGYLIIIDTNTGNIIRMTNVFDRIKKSKKDKIKPTGFILAKNKIYLSLNNGKLIIISIENGKTLEMLKIDSDKISRPYVFDKNMYLIKNNAILKII